MSSNPHIQSLADAAPIALLGIEGVIVITIIGLWLIKLYALQHLPDVKPERKPHFLSKQLGILVSFSTMLLCSLAIAIWFLGSHVIGVLEDAKSFTPEKEQPIAQAEQKDPIEPSDVLEIFETSAHSDMTLESIKTRYENALSGAYILHHCNRASEEEIEALLGALRNDIVATQTKTPNQTIDIQSLYSSIVSAAEGSYHMMYATLPCDTPQVAMLEQQFANFIMKYHASNKK